MVRIRKKVVDGKEYYYLEHSFREGKKVRKKELYLGSEVPSDIEKIRQDFIHGIYKNKWYELLDNLKRGYTWEIRAMPQSVRDKELDSFMIKFTYNTQRIEGSRLTLRETANLLEKGVTPQEKPLKDVKEAEAHKKIFYEMLNYKKNLSLQVVLYWHKELFSITNPGIAGRIRAHGVAISGSKFMPPIPAELETELKDFFDWYGRQKDKLNPVELAALVHLKFVTIHPFADGNGRLSRIMMNFVLKQFHYPLFDIVYEKRNSYYNALERSQVKKDEKIFVQWFIKKYIKENNKHTKKTR